MTFTIEGVGIPDSKLAHEITGLVRNTELPLLFNHSLLCPATVRCRSFWPGVRTAWPSGGRQNIDVLEQATGDEKTISSPL